MRQRSAVVILVDGALALIRRNWEGREYYLFPGGGVDPGESAEQAAVREAKEELGWDVELGSLVAVCELGDGRFQQYYSATVNGGVFGSGDGIEMSFTPESPDGSHTPVLVPVGQLAQLDVRPAVLAARVADDSLSDAAVFRFREGPA